MATADQLKALIQSHVDGDQDRFRAIAIQAAAQAARNGHTKLARELKELVDQGQGSNSPTVARPVPLAQPKGELAGLLLASYPKVRLEEMALAPETESQLRRVIQEQVERSRLRQYGFSPQRKLLLVGPPGTGKTMSTSVLASELNLPLFSVKLDGLISKFLGETAAKLRLVFDAISQTRGVYFFDEFDALGSERTASNDVAELRRVLNSFLQFLEQDGSDSLLVAATNHAQLLDVALFRRFDAVIDFGMPTPELAEHVMRSRLASLDCSKVDWFRSRASAAGLSHAEIVRACEDAAKEAILEHRFALDAPALVAALEARRGSVSWGPRGNDRNDRSTVNP